MATRARLLLSFLAIAICAGVLFARLLDGPGSYGTKKGLAEGANSVSSLGTYASGVLNSVHLDPDGNPVISTTGGAGLTVVHCNDTNCIGGDESSSPGFPGAPVVGFSSSLELDTAGYPVISYYYSLGAGTQDLRVIHCNDADCVGNDESVTAPDTGGDVGRFSSLQLDSTGYPVVSYVDQTNQDLKVLHCNDPNCTGNDESIVAVDSIGVVGHFSSLELDGSGNPVVAYYDTTNIGLKILHCNDANCAGGDESITTPNAGENSAWISLFLDAGGRPVVSYQDATNFDLKLLHCNDVNCSGADESLTIPDSSGNVGSFTSLALDGTGNPVVSYRHETNQDLMVLACNDPNCSGTGDSVFAPDFADAVGVFTSLTLDGLGRPVVAYRDDTNNALKVLHCINPTCVDKTPPTATPTPTFTPTYTPTSTPTATPTPTPIIRSRMYTLDADFDEGVLANLDHDPPGDHQLVLSQPPSTYRFVNIAASGRGTVVRVDVEDGTILGEYYTAPSGMGRDPSRTTVDHLGSVWVANRAEFGFSGGSSKGSVARIGIITGGTRSDANGTPNPSGLYLAPPFQYSTCTDRNSDGLIKTSSGLADIRTWTNAGGVDTHGGVATADDECIINYTRVTGTGTRTLAIDSNNDVWVGGFSNNEHEKLDGVTGQPVAGSQFNLGCGGYGGLIDGDGVLWSAGLLSGGLLRYEPSSGGSCLLGRGNYGLGIDPNTGHVWQSSYESAPLDLFELDNAGTIVSSHPQPFTGQGVAVDGLSHVWMAEYLGTRIWHLAPDPANPGQYIPVGTVGGLSGSTGVAVDANGKIWAPERTGNRVSRIDPNAGPLGCGGTGCGAGYTVGAIDLTVPLGPSAAPYNYSDMTGFVSFGSTAPQGTWTVIFDSTDPATEWGKVSWNTENAQNCPAAPGDREPPGTSITARARSSQTQAGLSGEPWVNAPVGNDIDPPDGRFLQVEVKLLPNAANESPVLCDVTLEGVAPPPKKPEPGDTDGDGCSDQRENGLNPLAGGMRNYVDPHDYFNPTRDKKNRVDDILLVVQAYFDDDADGTPGLPPYESGYNPDTDRSNMAASPNAWNTGAPDGLQRVQDIVHALNSYFHDCA